MVRGQVVTFEAMAQDVLQDGGQVDELLRCVVDGLSRGLLQQSFHREPEERRSQSAPLRQEDRKDMAPGSSLSLSG